MPSLSKLHSKQMELRSAFMRNDEEAIEQLMSDELMSPRNVFDAFPVIGKKVIFYTEKKVHADEAKRTRVLNYLREKIRPMHPGEYSEVICRDVEENKNIESKFRKWCYDEHESPKKFAEQFKRDSCGFPMAYCQECGVSASYEEKDLSGESRCCQNKLHPIKPNGMVKNGQWV